MDCSTPGLPVHHQLPELAQTHAHRVRDAIQPSHPLLSPSTLDFNISQHQGLFQWVSSSVLSFLYSPTDLHTAIYVTSWISLVLVRNSARGAVSSHHHPWLCLLLLLKVPPSEMRASKLAQMIKNLPAMRETGVQSLGREDPLEKGNGSPLQDSCLENSHGQRSLVGATVCEVTKSLTQLRMST